MASDSKIEWTDSTWNPVTGCTKVSPGCDNCYAETFAERFRGTPGHHFENGFDVQLRPDKLTLPLRWRKPRRVFVNSMSDLFHKDIPDEYIARVFAVMAATPQHSYQVLTKRHARMQSLLSSPNWRGSVAGHLRTMLPGQPLAGFDALTERFILDGVLSHVWLGVSVEDQKWADIRIPALLQTPAAVRFLSCEPLLGPVDLRSIPYRGDVDYLIDPLFRRYRTPGSRPTDGWGTTPFHSGMASLGGLDWVIAGGESGRGARPMHPDWARQLRDQCTAARVPFFFKQWGAWAPGDVHGWYSRTQWVDSYEGGPAEFMYAPKSKSMRDLDGRTWDEYPAAVARV